MYSEKQTGIHRLSSSAAAEGSEGPLEIQSFRVNTVCGDKSLILQLTHLSLSFITLEWFAGEKDEGSVATVVYINAPCSSDLGPAYAHHSNIVDDIRMEGDYAGWGVFGRPCILSPPAGCQGRSGARGLRLALPRSCGGPVRGWMRMSSRSVFHLEKGPRLTADSELEAQGCRFTWPTLAHAKH
ncbi:hypothetical protein SKAU_G00390250 [Synaphobranchus kaupii]|uniref:Uncharacterized protein n=1 Tax=Synaphobranchus kaupii TaxID=118154 RepID=A0A9Q1IBI8_SYNKA|nr:hypothetical protein SKAU_G00390250 [Synaphobranchus kaupii]